MNPLQVTISLLEAAMKNSGKQHFLIDGFPRNEENRAAFESQVSNACMPVEQQCWAMTQNMAASCCLDARANTAQ